MLDNYLEQDAWRIIERGWNPLNQTKSESIFSLGNGRMGQRANFEEDYSGETFQGNYVAGVYYPDKTKVGWWKNGYPEYFAKVLNAVNWIGLRIAVNGEKLDLNTVQVSDFYRELNMQHGYLQRSFIANFANGNAVKIVATRFLSLVDDEVGALSYSITPLNFSGEIVAIPYLDFDVENEDSNYEEKFWEEVEKSATAGKAHVCARTKKLDFQVCAAMRFALAEDGNAVTINSSFAEKLNYVENTFAFTAEEGKSYRITKYSAVLSSLNHTASNLANAANQLAEKALEKGFDAMLAEHAAAWEAKWNISDIEIDGDISAQQGIRFNIFQLNQTVTGVDARLNIGPKGFTGEK